MYAFQAISNGEALAMIRFATALIFLPALLTASAQTLIPTTINVGSRASTFGVAQGVIISSVISPSTLTTGPTGTVQFLANGAPVGSPVTLTTGGDGAGFVTTTLPINVPGNYTITATYSGDATYKPATSYNSWPANVVQNPDTVVINLTMPSLTFASGATTGNADIFELVPINGFHGALQYDCSITLNPGTPAPAFMPTCELLSAFEPDGTLANSVAISTTAPTTVTTTATSHSEIPVAALLCAMFFLPRLRRHRLGPLFAVMFCCIALISLSGCSAGIPPAAPPVKTTIESSAGSYTILLQGVAFDGPGTAGNITIFSATIPLTVK
jgi:Bacterial Ig-like domain (group 3)